MKDSPIKLRGLPATTPTRIASALRTLSAWEHEDVVQLVSYIVRRNPELMHDVIAATLVRVDELEFMSLCGKDLREAKDSTDRILAALKRWMKSF